MEKTDLIAYLRSKANGNDLMNSKQLQSVTGMTVKKQSDLRKDNEFPFPYKIIGRLAFYSIYAVADYLFETETEQKEPQQKQPSKKPSSKTPTLKQFRREPQDLSRIIMLKTMLDNMKKEQKILNNLILPTERFIQAKSLFDELKKDLQ